MLKSGGHNSLIYEMKVSYGFFERAINLFKRYLGWEMVFLVYSLVNTLTICFIGVSSGDPNRVLYLMIGAVLWGFLSLLFFDISDNIAWERWEGTIEYTLMAPIHRLSHLLGSSISSVIFGLIRTGLIIGAASLFFNINLSNANIPAAVLVLTLSSISFLGLGLLGAVLPLLSPEKGIQATHILQSMILLISGIYYEITVLPAWLQPLSRFSPATYTLQAMRMALLEGAGIYELRGHLLTLLLMGVILIPLGFLGFSIAEKYARRTGKLSRSG